MGKGSTMGRTILIVDDSNTMRKMVRATLGPAGFDVVEAQDGIEALNRLMGGGIDLVIADVNMPVMDGLTFTRQARSLDASRGTPILILTTEAGREMKEQGRAAGASGWIVKPFHPKTLTHAVEKVLLKCGQADDS
jgi:two-component system, chemotaxis family, chemotaxis protein CheY